MSAAVGRLSTPRSQLWRRGADNSDCRHCCFQSPQKLCSTSFAFKSLVKQQAMEKQVTFVERLLIREEIDSLELDLARARALDNNKLVSDIEGRIARLEATLAISRRADVRVVVDKQGRPLTHAA